MPFGKERKSLQGEIPEEFSMSAVDMSMIDHISDMIENGVDSLKIEGRMKSIHYVSTVTNCYKAAVDAYLESPEKFEAIKQDLVDEMWKVAQRELATGFYYGIPSENEQLFGARRKIPEYKFVAEVVSYDDATQTATIRQRNVINEGDQVEFYGPGFRHFETYIEDLHDAKGQLFVNETSLTKGTKLSFMVQVSVILKPILKICMMPKAIKSTALQIQWNY
ncbi:putative protease [Streptococcus pneumoniae]|nr:putative protease [Streptococcus pneumoniae]